MKFIVKKDLYITIKNVMDEEERKKILSNGDIIEPNENYEYEINGSLFSIEKLRSSDHFEELPNLEISEVREEDDVIKKWRIEFEVETTKSKLKEFEKIFYETINKIF